MKVVTFFFYKYIILGADISARLSQFLLFKPHIMAPRVAPPEGV